MSLVLLKKIQSNKGKVQSPETQTNSDNYTLERLLMTL